MAARHWHFTINNWNEEDITTINMNIDKFTYIIYGKEIAPSTGTPHLQGYVCLTSKKTLKTAQSLISNKKPHMSVCKGTPEQNKDYCSKEDPNPFEYGTLPAGKGERTDLAAMFNWIEEERPTILEIARSYTPQWCAHYKEIEQCLLSSYPLRCAYNKTIDRFIDMITSPRSSKTHVTWIHGKSGSGKTFQAWNLYPEKGFKYPKMNNNKWWCGLENQKVIIWDDFRPNKETPFNYMLNLMDEKPMRIETKNGGRSFIAENIIFTSIHTPEELYHCLEVNEDLYQFKRRINRYIEMENRVIVSDAIDPFINQDMDIETSFNHPPRPNVEWDAPIQRALLPTYIDPDYDLYLS